MSWDDEAVLEKENLAAVLKTMGHEEEGIPIGAQIRIKKTGFFYYVVRVERYVTKKDYKRIRQTISMQRKDYTEEFSPKVTERKKEGSEQ